VRQLAARMGFLPRRFRVHPLPPVCRRLRCFRQRPVLLDARAHAQPSPFCCPPVPRLRSSADSSSTNVRDAFAAALRKAWAASNGCSWSIARRLHSISRGGHNWRGGGTVEGSRSLDVMMLARACHLSDGSFGSWRWTYGDGTTASVDFQGGRREIILAYRVRSYSEDWQSVRQRVPIRWTPCRFGGERPWFVCDVHANGVYCGRRVAKLYGAGRLFACRNCYRLGYAIQRDRPMDRAHHRLRRLHRKLGADYDGPDGMPPRRPKWMRQRTYDRVVQQIEAGEDGLDVVFTLGAQRILARIDKLERRRGMRR
jgi:hypothetical protein